MTDESRPVPETGENAAAPEMTAEEMAAWIDGQSYEGLLRWWRFAPPGDPFFQGETGEHYARVMAERRAGLPEGGAAEASSRVGWLAPGTV